MNLSAIILLLTVQITVTAMTLYFIIKIVRSGRKE